MRSCMDDYTVYIYIYIYIYTGWSNVMVLKLWQWQKKVGTEVHRLFTLLQAPKNMIIKN